MIDLLSLLKDIIKFYPTVIKVRNAYRNIDDDIQMAYRELRRKQCLYKELQEKHGESSSEYTLRLLKDAGDSLDKADKVISKWAVKLDIDISTITSLSDTGSSETLTEEPNATRTSDQADSAQRSQHDTTQASPRRRRRIFAPARATRRAYKRATYLNSGRHAIEKSLKSCNILPDGSILAAPVEAPDGSFNFIDHPALPFVHAAKCRAESDGSVRQFDHGAVFNSDAVFQDDDYEEIHIIKNLTLPGDSPHQAYYFLDRIRQPEDSSSESKKRADDAAMRFAKMFQLGKKEIPRNFCNATGLLPCAALVEYRGPPPPGWEILFELPIAGEPSILRRLMAHGNITPDLPTRISFARNIAESILIMHAMGLVHKGIRPDNVLVLKGDDDHCIGRPFLIGFNQVRDEKEESGRRNMYDANQQRKNIYVHPSLHKRSGKMPRNYQALDDIYSFGVMLLEILLWKSFFIYDNDPECEREYWEVDKSVLEKLNKDTPGDQFLDILKAKANDLNQYSSRLTGVVEYCLDCWKRHGSEKGGKVMRGEADFEVSAEASQAIEFVANVWTELRDIESSLTKEMVKRPPTKYT